MNFIRKIVKPYTKEEAAFYSELKKLVQFSPKDLSQYKKAFTHRSLKLVDPKGLPFNYERLEFLGDAMLDAVIGSYLYKKAPQGDEGYLTQMRSKIVSREHLNELGKDLNLIKYLHSNIAKKNIGDNIHGNIFEALIGAIYLDRGYNYCKKFVYSKVIVPYVDIAKLEGKITSYKGLLIEWCQKKKKTYAFESYEDSGNETVKHFSVKASISGKLVGKGRATSKKKAEEQAAKRAYYALQNHITTS